jgi:hypothetical protein
MKTAAIITGAITLFASHALAAIALGCQEAIAGGCASPRVTYAWIDGEKCNKGSARNLGQDNYCGREFTLDNGVTYRVMGCGGGLWLDEKHSDGSWHFNSNCPATYHEFNCGDLSKMLHIYQCS